MVDKSADPNSLAAFGDTKTQTVGVLNKIQDILKGMGWSMGDVVKMQVFLVGDPAKGGKADVAGFMEGYTQFFGGAQPNLPARAVVQVAGLSIPAGWSRSRWSPPKNKSRSALSAVPHLSFKQPFSYPKKG
jgi:enamine deaminase RidA (YjgF/YER057c/UK114 family)